MLFRPAAVVLLVLAFAGAVPGPSEAQTAGIIREIVVEGAQRIEPETVLSYLSLRRGDRYSQSRADRSLKKLFGTGLFADVAMVRRGDRLIVRVVENPVINRIAFEGNRRIDDEELQNEVTLRPRVIYTRTKVQNDVQRILTLYQRQGRFAATVDPKVIRLEQNRVDLAFEITEGNPTEVERIGFLGNREFSDSRLREEIRTKETRWWRFLSGEDTYDPDRLTFDRELLRRFYLNEGFADFQVRSVVAEMTPDREDFFITFTIEEGPRYALGKVALSSNIKGLNVDDVADVVEMEAGDWYEADEIEDTVNNLTNEVGELGFAFVDVRPRLKRNRDAATIDIEFAVNEGPRIFVERIDIAGNVRTQDEVIRREFRLVEGDPFNVSKLRRSRQRLQDLNFFEKVEVEQVPGSDPDKTVIEVEVEEKSTGSLSLGAGFSTTNGALMEIGVSEANLLGKGQKLNTTVTIAQSQSKINFSFTEPYFLDREIAAGFDISHSSTDYQDTSSYDEAVTGFSLRMGYPITERLSQSWRYTLRQTTVENVNSSASTFIQSQEGTSLLSEITHSISYDRRDSTLNPTDGYITSLTTSVGGLGGDRHYLKNTIRGGSYYPIDDQVILNLQGTIGYIYGLGEDVKLVDRFFVGGEDLRGFATAGIGPRDKSSRDALGGEFKYTGTVQLDFPLGLPSELGISGRLFTDLGTLTRIRPTSNSVFDTGKIRVSSGFGVGWISPVGPIGVDFGFPWISEDHDEQETIRINFGTRF